MAKKQAVQIYVAKKKTVGKAKKRPNKHESVKPYRGQGR